MSLPRSFGLAVAKCQLLKQALAEHLDWRGARLSFLAQFILALFKVRTVNFAELAPAFSGRAKLESHYRRLQRFFQQFAIDEATVARLVVRLVPVGEGPWYLTQAASKSPSLRISSAYQRVENPPHTVTSRESLKL